MEEGLEEAIFTQWRNSHLFTSLYRKMNNVQLWENSKPGRAQDTSLGSKTSKGWLLDRHAEFYSPRLLSRVINEATQPPFRQHCLTVGVLKASSVFFFVPLAELHILDKLLSICRFPACVHLDFRWIVLFLLNYSLADPAALGVWDISFKQVAIINYSELFLGIWIFFPDSALVISIVQK